MPKSRICNLKLGFYTNFLTWKRILRSEIGNLDPRMVICGRCKKLCLTLAFVKKSIITIGITFRPKNLKKTCKSSNPNLSLAFYLNCFLLAEDFKPKNKPEKARSKPKSILRTSNFRESTLRGPNFRVLRVELSRKSILCGQRQSSLERIVVPSAENLS